MAAMWASCSANVPLGLSTSGFVAKPASTNCFLNTLSIILAMAASSMPRLFFSPLTCLQSK